MLYSAGGRSYLQGLSRRASEQSCLFYLPQSDQLKIADIDWQESRAVSLVLCLLPIAEVHRWMSLIHFAILYPPFMIVNF